VSGGVGHFMVYWHVLTPLSIYTPIEDPRGCKP
jgi:hypothetical protein